MVEPTEQPFQPERWRPGCRELDREGKTVHAIADWPDERSVCVLHPERGIGRPRTLEEERGGIVVRKRPDRHDLLAGDAQAPRLVARTTRSGARPEEEAEILRGGRQVLEVVDHEQDRLPRSEVRKRLDPRGRAVESWTPSTRAISARTRSGSVIGASETR